LVDAAAGGNGCQGASQQLGVAPQRPAVDVGHVEGEPVLPRQHVSTLDLRTAGQAGAHLVAASLLRGVAIEIGRQQRPWADQAHVATQHVDQLGQLVEAGGAQPAAEAGDAGLVGAQVAVGVAVVAHGAQLVEAKGLAVTSRAHLCEHDRAAHGRADGRGDDRHGRRGEDQRRDGGDHVHGALDPLASHAT
jgi:hypothetical protein